MLQIATGKLFQGQPGQRNELRGILYTNLYVNGEDPIETAAGRLLPTSYLGGRNGLVYEITELIEHPPSVGSITSHTVFPYLNDFAAVASFAINVTCTPARNSRRALLMGDRV